MTVVTQTSSSLVFTSDTSESANTNTTISVTLGIVTTVVILIALSVIITVIVIVLILRWKHIKSVELTKEHEKNCSYNDGLVNIAYQDVHVINTTNIHNPVYEEGMCHTPIKQFDQPTQTV